MSGLSSVLKFALIALSAYVVLVVIVFMGQRRLLYLPTTAPPAQQVVQAMGLTPWPASGESYRGYVANAQAEDIKGTIIVFHGNAGRAVDRSHYVRALSRLGYRVLLAEYPGYGGRSGSPSEATLVADAKETVELAHELFGDPIILWGESLGSGVVSAVAANTAVPIEGVVLVTPWDSLPKLAQSIYWFLPARWLVLDQYDNVKNLRSYPGPVAIVSAEQDEIIPAAHSQRLYASILGEKRQWVLSGAGHNSWPVEPEASWWTEVTGFIDDAGVDDSR